jgi:mono/diheme cytochrome c family protein
MLFELTKYGPQKFAGADYESKMPAYDGQLTDEEIWNVLAYIKSKWPQQIQNKHTKAFGK